MKESKITEEQLEQFLIDMLPSEPKFVMYQGCLDKGTAKRTEIDANLCENPKCSSCRDFEKRLEKLK
jgi:hypothetical protein